MVARSSLLGIGQLLQLSVVAIGSMLVNGFFGSTVWESWYMWPPQRLKSYEDGWDLFVERWKGNSARGATAAQPTTSPPS